MSDIINNQLTYLLPQKAQEISDSFAELNKILTGYKNEIFNALYIDQEDFNSKIGNKLKLIKESIKPYHILKQGYEFKKQIEKEILQAKNKKKDGIRFFPFYDSRNIIRCVLEDNHRKWVGEHPRIYYKTRSDERLDSLYKGEENKAYKFIRDTIQKLIDDNKKQGIEIWLNKGFYEETERFYDVCINYRLSDKFLNNTESENTEGLESMHNIPELENENYKIDRDMSVTEKLKNGRVKKIDANGVVYLEKNLHKKYLGIQAYVREYLGGVNAKLIGEQKFNVSAVKKLGLEQKLPKNIEEFEKIIGNDHQTFIQQYLSKGGELVLSGYLFAMSKEFIDINEREYLRLGNGDSIAINQRCIDADHDLPDSGVSVRLVKGRQ